jgi:hypothetical protein
MSRTPDTISTLRDVLGHCRTIAVVGLSPQWHRPSFFAAKYMQAHGYRIVPVNPVVARMAADPGEPATQLYEAEQAIARGGRIDMVDAFTRAEATFCRGLRGRSYRRALPGCSSAVGKPPSALKTRPVISEPLREDRHAPVRRLGWMGVNTGVITAKRLRQLPY